MDKAIYEKELLTNVIASIKKHGGKDCLSSIVLTGSLGRGEPTYMLKKNGELKLKSDVEIALIFPRASKKNSVDRIIRNVSSEFEEDLNLIPINETRIRKVHNFNFSYFVPKYKTIFTYDLFNGSKTIWGKDFISEKSVTLADVDPYEAKRLVANRIGELAYLQVNGKKDQREYLIKQWKGKLVLAIASAWLIYERAYVSSYHGQRDNLIIRSEQVEQVIGRGFIGEYNKVFSFLRGNGEMYEVSNDLLREYVNNIDLYFKEKGINTPKVNSLSRYLKNFLKYIKTGMKYGIFVFENNILQSLIANYEKQSNKLYTDAAVWHRVLY